MEFSAILTLPKDIWYLSGLRVCARVRVLVARVWRPACVGRLVYRACRFDTRGDGDGDGDDGGECNTLLILSS